MVADMTLRFGSRRVPTTVHWPDVATGALALVLSDELSPLSRWVRGFVVVSITGGQSTSVEHATLQWVAEHVEELGAPTDRLLVAGGARAARLVLEVRDGGWPVVHRQLLVHPAFTAAQPMPAWLVGAPPATVVWGAANDDGSRYAQRLREAGIEVREVHDDGRC